MRDVQWFVVATADLPRMSYARGKQAMNNSPLQACALLDSALKAASMHMVRPSSGPQDVVGCCQTPAAATQALQLLSLDDTPAVSSSNCMGSIAGSIKWQLQSSSGSGKAAPVCPSAPLRPRPRVALIPATELPLSLMQPY